MAGRSAFAGLCLSTEVQFPELSAAGSGQSFDLVLVDRDAVPATNATVIHEWTSGSKVVLSVARVGGTCLLEFEDGTVFEFANESRTVTGPIPLDMTARHQLLDQVLPRVLDDLGHLMVHGSAIDTPGGAVIFIGDTGRGKSTLAASFESAGIDLLSDDCMRLTTDSDGCVTCIPTYRSLRLWPDSAGAVMPTAPFEPMAADSSKRRLGLALPKAPPNGHSTVTAVCALADPNDDANTVSFAHLTPARAVSLLLAQCFRLDPTDAEANRRTFERCADIVEQVPVVELSYPRDFDRLPDVRDAVLQRAASGEWSAVTSA